MPHLNIKEIEAYLNDTLTPQASKEVEQHLLYCSLCEEAIEGFALYQNQNSITNWDKDSIKPVHVVGKLPAASARWKWAAAAMLIAPLVGGYLLSGSNTSNIFAAHYSTMPADAATMRSGGAAMINATKSKMDTAMELFGDIKYKESFVALKNIADAESTNMKAAFFAGCSAMEINKWEEAQALLERVHLAEANDYSNHALWYLALTKLQLNETERAKDFLREIIAENSPWKPNAEHLLQDLK